MGVSHLPILIILVVIALIVFGPKRLPELGQGLGKAITEFKKGAAELTAPVVATTAAPSVQSVSVLPASPVAAPVTPAAADVVSAPGATMHVGEPSSGA